MNRVTTNKTFPQREKCPPTRILVNATTSCCDKAAEDRTSVPGAIPFALVAPRSWGQGKRTKFRLNYYGGVDFDN
jgi:hypothetical protein